MRPLPVFVEVLVGGTRLWRWSGCGVTHRGSRERRHSPLEVRWPFPPPPPRCCGRSATAAAFPVAEEEQEQRGRQEKLLEPLSFLPFPPLIAGNNSKTISACWLQQAQERVSWLLALPFKAWGLCDILGCL